MIMMSLFPAWWLAREGEMVQTSWKIRTPVLLRSQFDKDSNLPICQGVKYLNLTRVSFVLSLNHSPSRYQIYFETHIVSLKAITVNGSVTPGPEKQMRVRMKMSPLLDFPTRWRLNELQLLECCAISFSGRIKHNKKCEQFCQNPGL